MAVVTDHCCRCGGEFRFAVDPELHSTFPLCLECASEVSRLTRAGRLPVHPTWFRVYEIGLCQAPHPRVAAFLAARSAA